jgi:hypothetical protein
LKSPSFLYPFYKFGPLFNCLCSVFSFYKFGIRYHQLYRWAKGKRIILELEQTRGSKLFELQLLKAFNSKWRFITRNKLQVQIKMEWSILIIHNIAVIRLINNYLLCGGEMHNRKCRAVSYKSWKRLLYPGRLRVQLNIITYSLNEVPFRVGVSSKYWIKSYQGDFRM